MPETFIVISLFYCFRVFLETVLRRGFSKKSRWQQVFWSLQDSFQYSDRSQQYCSLNCLPSSSYFQVLKSFYQVIVPRAPIAICITVTFMVHFFFYFLERSWNLSLSINSTLWSAGTKKSTILHILFFYLVSFFVFFLHRI